MPYRVRNWSDYNAGLKQRGSLTLWLSKDALEQWVMNTATGRRGASQLYSDTAIATVATLKSVFHLAGRQAQGFVESVFQLMNIPLPVPDHSTVSRRLSALSVSIPVQPQSRARHVVVDSTGVKVYGEGEWKARQHGVGKRRTWRKLHLGIDESTGESMVAEVTTNDCHDSEILPSLLEGIAGEMAQVSGDGAYDTFACHEAIAQRGAAATIPPRHDARPPLSMEYLTRPTPGTKSCNVLSRWIVRTGGKRAAITVGLLLKPLCFVSRSPLGARPIAEF
jgi:hypothetical protein